MATSRWPPRSCAGTVYDGLPRPRPRRADLLPRALLQRERPGLRGGDCATSSSWTSGTCSPTSASGPPSSAGCSSVTSRRWPGVRAVRRRGLMTGVELDPPADGLRWGRRVCAASVRDGVLLRPLGDVVVLMPHAHLDRRRDRAHRDRCCVDAIVEVTGARARRPCRALGRPPADEVARTRGRLAGGDRHGGPGSGSAVERRRAPAGARPPPRRREAHGSATARRHPPGPPVRERRLDAVDAGRLPARRSTGSGRPAVILVHGGAWSQGSPDDLDAEGKLLGQQGWVGVQHQLPPGRPGPAAWPGELDGCAAAPSGGSAPTPGVTASTPTRIALLGNSAGGHLAGAGRRPGASATIRACRSIADPAKATPVQGRRGVVAAPRPGPARARRAGRRPISCRATSRAATVLAAPAGPRTSSAARPRSAPPTYRRGVTCRRGSTQSTVPMWFANATARSYRLPQAERLDDALTTAGVDHQLQKLDRHQHARRVPSSKVWNQMMPWLATQLGVADAASRSASVGDEHPARVPRGDLVVGVLGSRCSSPLTVAAIRRRLGRADVTAGSRLGGRGWTTSARSSTTPASGAPCARSTPRARGGGSPTPSPTRRGRVATRRTTTSG